MNQTLSIVIPAYNESKRILRTLDNIDNYITKTTKPNLFQVIVINDGSTDSTSKAVNAWIGSISKHKNCFSLVSYTVCGN